MRFYHLADLHIGKKVNGFSMLEDQAYALEGVLAAVDRDRPDALLLAGDLYDRRNPGPESMALLDDFLTKIILDRKIPVLAIGGNHDSGDRLDFAQGILARAGYYMAGSLQLPLSQVRLEDEWGPVDVTLLPFADKARLRHLLDKDEESYFKLMQEILETVDLDPDARQVLVAHGVVLNSNLERSDSERELFIGGTDLWSSPRLAEFDYVALGHLHKAQCAGPEHIYYAGSLCKYSFSEEKHCKELLCVDLDSEGCVKIRPVPIPQLREMVTLKGKLEKLESGEEPYSAHRKDYVRAILTDEAPVMDPMARLRAVYPYIMVLERESMIQGEVSGVSFDRAQGLKPIDYFSDFYQSMTGQEPSEEEIRHMKSLFRIGEEGAHDSSSS